MYVNVSLSVEEWYAQRKRNIYANISVFFTAIQGWLWAAGNHEAETGADRLWWKRLNLFSHGAPSRQFPPPRLSQLQQLTQSFCSLLWSRVENLLHIVYVFNCVFIFYLEMCMFFKCFQIMSLSIQISQIVEGMPAERGSISTHVQFGVCVCVCLCVCERAYV